MLAPAVSALWNQRSLSDHSSPDPLVRAGAVSSAKVNVPPSTTATSLPPSPPSGFAVREHPSASTHSTTNSTLRVPGGGVKTRVASERNEPGQSFEVGVGRHESRGEPSTVPSASGAAIV